MYLKPKVKFQAQLTHFLNEPVHNKIWPIALNVVGETSQCDPLPSFNFGIFWVGEKWKIKDGNKVIRLFVDILSFSLSIKLFQIT
jgi:hypothetical protein